MSADQLCMRCPEFNPSGIGRGAPSVYVHVYDVRAACTANVLEFFIRSCVSSKHHNGYCKTVVKTTAFRHELWVSLLQNHHGTKAFQADHSSFSVIFHKLEKSSKISADRDPFDVPAGVCRQHYATGRVLGGTGGAGGVVQEMG